MDAPSYRPQIIVALIGTAGVISAALIANWDKLSGTRAAAPAAAAGTQPAAPGPAAAAGDAGKLSDAQHNAFDAAAGALDDVANRISASATPNLGGKWRSTEGYDFAVTQNGPAYSFQEYAPNGAWVGSGSGQLSGHQFRPEFKAPDLGVTAGQCSGDVAADGKSLSGNCFDRNSGKSWSFRLDR